MKPEEWPRLFITAVIVVGFIGTLTFHYTVGLEETLKNITVIAIGYWLGSSKGSQDNAARTDKMIDLAQQVQDDKK